MDDGQITNGVGPVGNPRDNQKCDAQFEWFLTNLCEDQTIMLDLGRKSERFL